MRLNVLLLALLTLSACTWETYQDQHGKTGLRQRYAPGTPVVYRDGTFARDQRYNGYRPVPVPVTRQQPADTPGWDAPVPAGARSGTR